MSTEGIYGIPLDVSATIVFLFVLFGAMLDKAGAGKYFVDLTFSLLGRFKGGPAKAAVLASGMTGMVSGSSIANVVTTGTFTIPMMKKVGYPDYKAGAVEVACSTNGQLMPPVMGAAAFIIAEYCNVDYLQVVKAAFVPAVVSYIALMYITHLEASKLGLKGLERSELPRFWPTFFQGIHYIIPILFLLFELVVRRRSPELAAFRAIASLALLIPIQNLVKSRLSGGTVRQAFGLSLRQIVGALVAGGRNMMGIGVAVAAAGIIVGVVTLGLGGIITEVIEVISGGNFLLITAIASLILGMGLPTTANYSDPIRTGFQGFTYDIRTAILPFMFIFNTDLLLIDVYSPWRIAWIFFTTLAAMFAFAALTQGFFIARNRWYEGILLGVMALVLLRPYTTTALLGLTENMRYMVSVGTLAVYAGVYLLQRARTLPRPSRPGPPAFHP